MIGGGREDWVWDLRKRMEIIFHVPLLGWNFLTFQGCRKQPGLGGAPADRNTGLQVGPSRSGLLK